MSLLYMCPITATVICEYLRNLSFSSLLCYDDFSKHAVSYRHLSLALMKPVGREAFPSDIFYLHSRIVVPYYLMLLLICVYSSWFSYSILIMYVLDFILLVVNTFIISAAFIVGDSSLTLCLVSISFIIATVDMILF